MALNRVDIGTKCTVKMTGEVGTLKKIYFYPTKYELEFSNNKLGHFSITDLEIDGIEQSEVKRITPKIPEKGIGERWSFWSPLGGFEIARSGEIRGENADKATEPTLGLTVLPEFEPEP